MPLCRESTLTTGLSPLESLESHTTELRLHMVSLAQLQTVHVSLSDSLPSLAPFNSQVELCHELRTCFPALGCHWIELSNLGSPALYASWRVRNGSLDHRFSESRDSCNRSCKLTTTQVLQFIPLQKITSRVVTLRHHGVGCCLNNLTERE